jgi:hypothetical protein
MEVLPKAADAAHLTDILRHSGALQIPREWHQLRSEALGPFRGLHIFEAELTMISFE